jgi:hypothetical protein
VTPAIQSEVSILEKANMADDEFTKDPIKPWNKFQHVYFKRNQHLKDNGQSIAKRALHCWRNVLVSDSNEAKLKEYLAQPELVEGKSQKKRPKTLDSFGFTSTKRSKK